VRNITRSCDPAFITANPQSVCYVRRILAQHLLFVFLAVVAPAWDFYDTRRLKRNPGSPQKITYYKTVCAWLWIASCVAVLTTGFQEVFTINAGPDNAGWLFGHAWVRYLVGTVIALFAALVLLPFVTVALRKLKNKPRTYRAADAIKSLDFFLPSTWSERRWWLFVCVTAGVCEEILYRGFLLHYLHTYPWALNLALSLAISLVMFGVVHLYAGVRGVIGSMVAGLFFALLFLLSGNLLLSMILHALTDLRMLVILRPPGAQTQAQAAT
jgi:uncharacterized protein